MITSILLNTPEMTIYDKAYVYMVEVVYDKSSAYGKMYIGRHNGNDNNYITGSKIIRRVIKKYGIDSINKTILFRHPMTDKQLNIVEKFFIKRYDTYNNGLNLTIGGEGLSGFKHSDKSIKLMSEAAIGHTRQIGIKNSFYGKKHSSKTKTQISKTKTGVKHTDESKRNMSVARTGIKNHFYGKKHNDETKRKISDANSLKDIYTMRNIITDEIFSGTLNEFYHQYGFRVYNILRNKNKKYKQWILI